MEKLEARIQDWIKEYKLRNEGIEPEASDIKRYPRIHKLFQEYNLLKEATKENGDKSKQTSRDDIIISPSPKKRMQTCMRKRIPASPQLKLSKLPLRSMAKKPSVIPRTPDAQTAKVFSRSKNLFKSPIRNSPIPQYQSPLRKVSSPIPLQLNSPNKALFTEETRVKRQLFSPNATKHFDKKHVLDNKTVESIGALSFEQVIDVPSPSKQTKSDTHTEKPKGPVKVKKRKHDSRYVSENFVRMNLKKAYKTRGRKKFRGSGFNLKKYRK